MAPETPRILPRESASPVILLLLHADLRLLYDPLMGEQSSSRLKGDDYQHLYSWYELLQLLDPASPYSYGYVEHPDAGAADDVTLHSGRSAKYTQVKFHVDQKSQYSSSSVLEVPPGSKRSILQKLFESWKELRASTNEEIEVWVVSNWASAHDIGQFILDSCAFKEEFFSAAAKSDAGQIRAAWQTSVGATEDELHQFCRHLRLRFGYGGFQELEEKVDDRMGRYGLRIGKDPRAIALDIVRGWIKQGGKSKRIDKPALEAVIQERALRAISIQQPAVSLWIHGWAKRSYDLPPTIELDWTALFNIETRAIPSQSVWDQQLFPQLIDARAKLAQLSGGTYVDFRGKLPLSASLAVGRVFAEALGFRFRVEQPSGGEILLWRSDAGAEPFELDTSETPLDQGGTAGLVALSITGDAGPDALRLAAGTPNTFRTFLSISPHTKPSSSVVRSAGEAVTIAIQTKEDIRRLRNEHKLNAVHLALYCPATVALFLGQRMNAIGDVVTWERSADGSYQRSVTLVTG
jgi:CBASS immunity sensor of nucleotide second messenger signals